ncbi:hypothetical protein Hanom_Chr17g01577251 [Helianthus anomalus]
MRESKKSEKRSRTETGSTCFSSVLSLVQVLVGFYRVMAPVFGLRFNSGPGAMGQTRASVQQVRVRFRLRRVNGSVSSD